MVLARLPTEATIRRASPADRPALEAIAATVWDGHDYLPNVIDGWLETPNSIFYVVEAPRPIAGYTVVGCARAAVIAPGEGWIEGVRVHPDARGQGYGDALVEYGTQWAMAHGGRATRFVTASSNTAIRRIAARLGYRLAVSYIPSAAPPLPPDQVSPELPELGHVSPEAVRSHWARLSISGLAHATGGFLTRGWHMFELNVQRLEDAAAKGQLYRVTSHESRVEGHGSWGTRDGGRVMGPASRGSGLSTRDFRLVTSDPGPAWVGAGTPRGLDLGTVEPLGVLGVNERGNLQLGWVAGSVEMLTDFGLATRRLASALGVEAATAMIPEGTLAEEPLRTSGFAPRTELRAFLFEHRIEWC